MNINGIEVDIHTLDSDGMSGMEKLAFIAEVVELKNKLVQLCDDMVTLNTRMESQYYEKRNPFMAFCANVVFTHITENGDALKALRDKVLDIHNRLYECNGVTSVVRTLQAEFEALRPEVVRLDAHFDSMREKIKAKEAEIAQNN